MEYWLVILFMPSKLIACASAMTPTAAVALPTERLLH